MRIPEYSTQFRRDVKRAQKRGKDMGRLKKLLELLIAGDPLSPQYKDHPLKNDWSGYRDAHIEPDWLLIYHIATARYASSALEPTPTCSTEPAPC